MGGHGNGPDATDRAGIAPARSACSHHTWGLSATPSRDGGGWHPPRSGRRGPRRHPRPRAAASGGPSRASALGAGVTVSASTVAGTVGAASVLGVVVGAASVAGVVGGASVLGVVSPQPAGRSRCNTPVFW